jgi:GT2 family glycosyltransferase
MAASVDLASIIIPVQNQEELTQLCLENIAARTNIIRNDTNLGFAKACNQGRRLELCF